ncbi:MAG: TonB-dependent siderophore receptor [Pseudomonadota bacterium]|nr:TonB-dependent siderophore receptor [Pseudomonadota bacterium]
MEQLPTGKRFGVALAVAMALTATAQAQGQQPLMLGQAEGQPGQLAEAVSPLHFNIAPQSLNGALAAFGEASNLQLLYDAALTRGLDSKGVRGDYTPHQALNRLLAGSGLSARFTSAATVTLESATDNEDEALPEVTVFGDWLGTPTQETVRTYSGSRSAVDAEQLHERGALNVEDALRTVPSVTVLDETGTGILPNIGVRGLSPFRSERVQVLQDGYPIAIGPYSNVGLSLFPITMQSVETIDVVRGGAAVHYGPNNVGGVINFITRPIPSETSQTLREQITIAEESGNVLTDTYYRAGGYVSDELALQLQVNALRGDGFRDHSDTEVNNFILDADYFPNDHHQLSAQLQYYDVNADLPGSLSPSTYEQDRTKSERPHDRFDADMTRGTLSWVYTPNDNTELEWRNFAHKADRTFFFGQNLSGSGHWADPAIAATHVADSPRLFSVYGTEPRLTHRIGDHTVTAGARFVKEKVEFDVNRVELATGTQSVTRDWSFDSEATALYVSDTIRLLDDHLAVTPGLRYEDVSMDYRNGVSGVTETNKASEVLPGITVGYEASNQLFVFANTQRSLVPVQTAQVTRDGDIANETAWNYELGARYQVNANLSTTTTLFQIDYEDQIQFNSGTSRFENLGETSHQGLELQADWQASANANLSVAYTYLTTEQLSGANEGKALPNAPSHRLSVGGDYQHQAWDLAATAVYVSDSYSDAANTEQETANGSAGELASYTLVNARISRDFNIDDNKFNLGLAINNVLDEDYYFRGVDVSPVGRVSAPGRSFTLSAQMDF